MKRVLITGGAGFIGSHLVDRLIELGHRVSVVDNLSTGKFSNLNGYAKFYNINLEDKTLENVFKLEQPEVVFHLAAQISIEASFKNPIHDGNTNIIASLKLLEQCKKYKVQKIIFASSAAVYGDAEILPITENTRLKPLSPYAISKSAVESYIEMYNRENKMEYVILRASNVFGPRQNSEGESGVISIFIDNFLKEKQCKIFGNGSQTRDFIYVKDLVDMYIESMKEEVAGIINGSSNSKISINDLHAYLTKQFSTNLKPIYDPNANVGIKHSCLSNKRAFEKLNLKTQTPFKTALKNTVEYYRNLRLKDEVWIIMAAYNAGEVIGDVLSSLNNVTEKIVVVDDGSRDNTFKVASKYRCHVIKHLINFGQGAALRTGMEYALKQGAKILVHFDSDGQMQIKDIEPMIELIKQNKCDVTFGSRYLRRGSKVPFTKKWFIHKPAIYFNWLFTGMKMSDAHCGFRAFSSLAAKKCVIRQNRMAHATEILQLVNTHRLRYTEVPVDIVYRHYGQLFTKSFEIFGDLIKRKIFY